jgi:phosphoesterase RecJ-like protein
MKKFPDKEVAHKIKESSSFLIASHVRPDADAVGSLLGFGLALKSAGKQVQMVLEDGAGKYSYLPGSDCIATEPMGDVDMLIIVDCSDPMRVGKILTDYPQPDLVVDHHITNLNFGKFNLVEGEQVATAAILFDYLPLWGLSIDAPVATCLLSGIIGDTIGFRTSNVDAEVLRKAADLMDLGANLSDIYRSELVLKSFEAIQYWGPGLNRLQRKNGLVWTSLTLEDRKKSAYPGKDDADLVNVLSSVNGADIALIFIEQSKNQVKVSWRARPGIDVSKIAFKFGGGGHAAAAGADLEGSLEEIQKRVIIETEKLLVDKNFS